MKLKLIAFLLLTSLACVAQSVSISGGVSVNGGSAVLNGSGAPSSSVGANSDFYIDTTNNCIYGPKASGVWPGSCVSLIGPSWYSGSATPIVTANWSAFGVGCSTSNTTTSGGGAAIQVISTTGAQNICGVKTSESGTFTRTIVFYGAVSSTNYGTVEVGFTDGTKTEYCGVGSGLQGSGAISAGLTDAKVSALTGGTLTTPNGGSASYLQPYVNPAGPNFFRLRAVSGTSLACDWSPDGVNWIVYFNDTTPYLTPNAVYFGADPRGGSGVAMGILASYQ